MRIEAIRIEDNQGHLLTDLSSEQAVELVHSESFTWIDIDLENTKAEHLHALLVAELDFHPATVEDCLTSSPYHQPKIDEEQRYQFISFFYYQSGKDGELAGHELNIYVSGNYVITLHREPIPELLAKFRDLPRHITDYSQRAVLFLHHILDVVIDSYAPFLTHIESRSGELELDVLSSTQGSILHLPLLHRHKRELGGMRQILRSRKSLIMLRRSLTAELEIIHQMISEYDYEGAPEHSEEIAIYYRDIADHISKYLEIIEREDETLNHLMEVNTLVTGHRTNEIIYILTIISTIILPLNLIVGFFGMNFENLWLRDWGGGIWLVSTGMLIICALLIWFFRAKKWI